MPVSVATAKPASGPEMAWSREHEANSHLLCLKSPLASAVYGGHNSPTFGWSPTTAAFFHKRNMQSPYYSGFDGTGISSALRREFSPSDSATIPLTARPNRNKGMSPGSTHDGSLPLTPSMYLASNGGGGGSGGSGNDHPHGLGGLNLNHVVTASEAAYNDGNDSSSRHLMPPSLYGHTHLHPHRHWDNSKTPTASTHRYAPTQNQIQPDLASASESSNTNEDDSKSTRDNSHTPTVSRPGDGNSASSSSGGVNLPPLAGVAAGLRTYSPKDLYSLSTPSRFSLSNTMDEHANGSSAGVGPGGLPPLRSGGLSWFLNDWPNSNGNPPTHNGIHAFRSIVGGPDGGFGSGGNVHPSALVNSNASNGVVFTPGGTLRESQSVIAPTSSTAAGALLSGGASRPVVMGKPPLAARAPRGRPSTASSRTSGPLSAFRSSAMSDDYAMSEANDEDDDRRHGREDPVHDGYRPYHSAPGGLSVPLPSPEELLSIKGGGGGGFNARTGDSYRASDSRQLRYETDEARWQAVQQRDARASAAFFYCVLTTKIFCRTTCPSRHPVRENIVFVKTAAEAVKQGYRACRRCKPDLQGGDPHEERQEALIAKVKERLYASVAASGKGKTVKGQGLKYIAEELGVSHWHLHRCFKKRVGTTPEVWAKLQAKKIRSSIGRQKVNGGGGGGYVMDHLSPAGRRPIVHGGGGGGYHHHQHFSPPASVELSPTHSIEAGYTTGTTSTTSTSGTPLGYDYTSASSMDINGVKSRTPSLSSAGSPANAGMVAGGASQSHGNGGSPSMLTSSPMSLPSYASSSHHGSHGTHAHVNVPYSSFGGSFPSSSMSVRASSGAFTSGSA